MTSTGIEHTIARDMEMGPGEYVAWAPFPGFQERVLAASEFELFIGGAKGPGKSDLIMVKPLAQVHLDAFKGLVVRETFPQMEDLIARARKLYPQVGGKWRAGDRQFQWYSDVAVSGVGYTGRRNLGLVEFGYCSSREDVERYQGREWAYVGVDELANLADEGIVEDFIKEIRCPNPAVLLQFVGSGNPGFAGQGWCKRRYVEPCGKHGEKTHEFIVKVPTFEDGRLKGERAVKRHRRFIPGKVQDNPIYANDPQYMATLLSLPEERRRQMFYGDWDAGLSTALAEVDEVVHVVKPFEVPAHWDRWGCLDWGFQHRWVFGAYAMSSEGRIYKLDTMTGFREYPDAIANKVLGRFPGAADWLLVTGRDLFNKRPSVGLDVPTRAEEFMDHGLPFVAADSSPGSRVTSLNNLRKWLKWKRQGPKGEDVVPAMLFFETPGNLWCVRQLQDMVVDPKNVEDVLKVNSDPQTGDGGDDGYDETRMGTSTRPYTPPLEDVTPSHHRRVHGRAQEIMEQAWKREQESQVAAESAEYEDGPSLADKDGEAWSDAMR